MLFRRKPRPLPAPLPAPNTEALDRVRKHLADVVSDAESRVDAMIERLRRLDDERTEREPRNGHA